MKITSLRSVCLLRQNNSSQTILGVSNDSITYAENQENKDRHAYKLNKEEATVSCGSILLALNKLAGANLLCDRNYVILKLQSCQMLVPASLETRLKNP